MHRIERHLLWILILFIISTLSVDAQEQANQVFVGAVQTAEQEDGLGLDVYFTLADNNNQIVPSAQVRSATLALGGLSYPAQISQPTTDFFIVMVLDASGSMSGAMSQMKEAAEAAIQAAPEGARFMVISFDHEIRQHLEDFSRRSDRNMAINAVRLIEQRGGGTCLYDATYSALEMLADAPAQRRAVILFTDGRDELTAGRGDTCSRRTVNDVITLASRSNAGTSIHTIGMTGAGIENQINRRELESIATLTGGYSAIGNQADLSGLFARIMEGLSSQWLASTLTYPPSGQQEAILRVTLDSGATVSTLVTFQSGRSYVQTPTPVPTDVQPTSTPLPVRIAITGIQTDVIDRTVSFEVIVENGNPVSEYLFRFINQDTGLQQGQPQVRTAPLDPLLTFGTNNWASGRYTIEVTAFGDDGNRLASQESSNFSYTLPTATPTITPSPTQTYTPTNTPTITPSPTQTYTPVPEGASIRGIQYDAERNVLILEMVLNSPAKIGNLGVEFIDSMSRFRVGNVFNFPPNSTVEITTAGIPAGRYELNVYSYDTVGAELARSVYEFTFQGQPTATPSPTPTATATPVVPSARLGNPSLDNTDLIFPVDLENAEAIDRFELEFIDENNIVQREFEFAALNGGQIRIPLAELGAGNYTVVLRILGADGRPVGDSASARFGYNPATPTPQPQPTPEPPAPPLLSAEGLRANLPIVIPVVVVLIAALLGVLFILIRRPQQQTATSFLEEMTGAVQAEKVAPVYTPVADIDPDATGPLYIDEDATNAIPQMLLPDAYLVVERSLDRNKVNERILIDHIPFSVGRKECDLEISGDKNLSRRHAEIGYDGQFFTIRDLGSTHGTVVNSKTLTGGAVERLEPGAQIILGRTTFLIFDMSAEG